MSYPNYNHGLASGAGHQGMAKDACASIGAREAQKLAAEQMNMAAQRVQPSRLLEATFAELQEIAIRLDNENEYLSGILNRSGIPYSGNAAGCAEDLAKVSTGPGAFPQISEEITRIKEMLNILREHRQRLEQLA